MKVTIEKDSILSDLAVAVAVAPTQSPKISTTHILLEARDGNISISATDGEVFVRFVVPCEVEDSGSVLVHPGRLLSILNEADGTIALSSDDCNLTIRFGRDVFVVYCLPHTDFPAPMRDPREQDVTGFDIQSTAFAAALSRVAFAVSTSKTRYAIEGVFLEIDPGAFRMIGTDGKRLSMVEMAVTDGAPTWSGVLPRKALEAVAKINEGRETMFTVSMAGADVAFDAGRAVVITRCLDGKFPPYRDAIPSRCQDEFFVALRDEWAQAMRRALMVTTKNFSSVTMDFKDDSSNITCSLEAFGAFDHALECERRGSPLQICVNPMYVLDFLKHCEGETFEMSATDPKKQILMRELVGPKMLYVVMPVNRED